jgi:hypothetical protein
MQVIYLMGTPFCGSTILGAALGMHSEVFDTGELLYWTYRTKKAGPCACGRPVEECEFWTEVGNRLQAQGIDLMRYRELQLQLEFMRAKGAGSLLRRKRGATADEYAATTLAVLETISQFSRKSIIVDTSKHPARGAALAGIPSLDVRFIHLLRNGRAFVASRMRRQKKGDPSRRGFIAQQSLNWSMTNLGIEFVCRTASRPYTRLKFEDFIAAPARSIESLGHTNGVDMSHVGAGLEQGLPIAFGHAVSGNALRVAGPTPLRREDRGGHDFPREREWIFSLFAGPMALRYGYRRGE